MASYCGSGDLFISITPSRNRCARHLENWFGIEPWSPLCSAASLFHQERDLTSWIRLKGSQRERVSGETAYMTVGYEEERKRSEKKPVARGNFVFVSGVWAHKHNSHSTAAFCFRCVPLCSERYQPAQGQSAAAFCSLCKEIYQIPKMNTWAKNELCRWFKTHNHIYTHTQTYRRIQTNTTLSVCMVKHSVDITNFCFVFFFPQLPQFDTYQKLSLS